MQSTSGPAGATLDAPLILEDIPALKREVRELAADRNAEVKAETDYCCTSSNAVQVVEHIWREHGEDTEILFGPDMFLGAYVENVTGRQLNVWTGECHVHAGIRPADIARVREETPGADSPTHPGRG